MFMAIMAMAKYASTGSCIRAYGRYLEVLMRLGTYIPPRNPSFFVHDEAVICEELFQA